MVWVCIALGVLWCLGWVLTIMAIGPLQRPKVRLAAELFFIWPILVWTIARE